MKKLTVNDLPNLSESDKGIVFNYFGALGGIARRRKQAFALAIFGCFVIGHFYHFAVNLFQTEISGHMTNFITLCIG